LTQCPWDSFENCDADLRIVFKYRFETRLG
jgi:hypothetical protein